MLEEKTNKFVVTIRYGKDLFVFEGIEATSAEALFDELSAQADKGAIRLPLSDGGSLLYVACGPGIMIRVFDEALFAQLRAAEMRQLAAMQQAQGPIIVPDIRKRQQ